MDDQEKRDLAEAFLDHWLDAVSQHSGRVELFAGLVPPAQRVPGDAAQHAEDLERIMAQQMAASQALYRGLMTKWMESSHDIGRNRPAERGPALGTDTPAAPRNERLDELGQLQERVAELSRRIAELEADLSGDGGGSGGKAD